ncbi:hypothetical protein HPP92_005649 [Vanilla planifolia]|uniref:Uncharacterized protein n=1 Tax=Vanilla planifolia TaxID=51239 RepID=A0A835RUG5_VANPL|nr:hypothetical protein HPP92_005649 [Vanilla planifolia]
MPMMSAGESNREAIRSGCIFFDNVNEELEEFLRFRKHGHVNRFFDLHHLLHTAILNHPFQKILRQHDLFNANNMFPKSSRKNDRGVNIILARVK